MRILLLSQWFDPEPTFKGLPFAKELVRLGHQVEVLTGFPNYPGGKVYPNYRIRLFQRENMDGIAVTRVALYPSHNNSALQRIANYVSFAASSTVLGLWFIKKPDVVYCYHPPATAALAAVVFRALWGVPFVYDIQDLWPDTLLATGMVRSSRLLQAVGGWCHHVYRTASRIAVLSPGFKAKLIERGVAPSKIHVIYNWADETAIRSASPPPENLREQFTGKFNVVFAGTMGKAQGLDTVLSAAKLLQGVKPEIQIVLIGGGIDRERLENKARDLGLKNLLFLPRCPVDKIGTVLEAADILLVHLKNDPLFRATIPSKIQAYLAIGKPILVAVPGDAAALVERAGAGITCPSENPSELASAIVRAASLPKETLKAWGASGRQFYDDELSLAQGTAKFATLFSSLRREPLLLNGVQRIFDVVFSSLGLVLLFPFLVATALMIRARIGAPVFFRQIRPGLHGRPFRILKFRTMTDERNAEGELLPDGERLHGLGKFLRRYSIDEFPQLWNVFKGDISLVGPRPLLMQYLERYTTEQARRLDVKPGITGWAQVNGRNAISWEERFRFDVYYVDHRSLALYFKILLKTFGKTVKKEGISQANHATMPEFMGLTNGET